MLYSVGEKKKHHHTNQNSCSTAKVLAERMFACILEHETFRIDFKCTKRRQGEKKVDVFKKL